MLYIVRQAIGDTCNAVASPIVVLPLNWQFLPSVFPVFQFISSLGIDNGLPKFLGKLQAGTLNDVCHRIDVVAVTPAPQTGCFERNGASTGERIKHARHPILECLHGIVVSLASGQGFTFVQD